MTGKYSLPELKYDYNALEPYVSEELLKIHHDKHHNGYVKGANAILEKLETSRKEGSEIDIKSTLKALSFNIGGHVLHSLFWENIGEDCGGTPEGRLAEAIDTEFGSYERFKDEFSKTAATVEGSGWAALTYCKKAERLMIMQIEKHNVNVYPMFAIILALDVWEHAYYLDYKNERNKFIEAFWKIINWKKVEGRFSNVCK